MNYQDDLAQEEPLDIYWRPEWIRIDRTALPMLFDAEGFPVIQVDPVPLQRRRRHGWSPDRQRAFIAMLARVPSVGHAAKAVNMTARSAYKLLEKEGAEQFGKAWDTAVEFGMTRLRAHGLERALMKHELVPVFRKGKLVRVEHRRNDKLAITLLKGQGRDVDAHRRSAQLRWRSAREWANHDALKAAEQKAKEEAAAAAHQEALDYFERHRAARIGPRIVKL
jgi:hypothetical protein